MGEEEEEEEEGKREAEAIMSHWLGKKEGGRRGAGVGGRERRKGVAGRREE